MFYCSVSSYYFGVRMVQSFYVLAFQRAVLVLKASNIQLLTSTEIVLWMMAFKCQQEYRSEPDDTETDVPDYVAVDSDSSSDSSEGCTSQASAEGLTARRDLLKAWTTAATANDAGWPPLQGFCNSRQLSRFARMKTRRFLKSATAPTQHVKIQVAASAFICFSGTPLPAIPGTPCGTTSSWFREDKEVNQSALCDPEKVVVIQPSQSTRQTDKHPILQTVKCLVPKMPAPLQQAPVGLTEALPEPPCWQADVQTTPRQDDLDSKRQKLLSRARAEGVPVKSRMPQEAERTKLQPCAEGVPAKVYLTQWPTEQRLLECFTFVPGYPSKKELSPFLLSTSSIFQGLSPL